MEKFNVTKVVSVERVTPPALLGYCKAVGQSEREMCAEYALEFDNREKAKWRTELFVRYAHRLLGCSEQIYADRRVFNTLIPIRVICCSNMKQNVFAPYVVQPTLGQFIYWWQTYKCSQIESEGLLYPILCWSVNLKFLNLSSDFTERNSALYVDSNGKLYCSKLELSDLYNLSKSFHEVCRLYPAEGYAHFDLEDAIEYLFGEKISR